MGWKVNTPSPNGNCTISITDSPSADSLQPLRPLDGSADQHMQFPCGRQATNFEAKEVRMPLDITCDACVLELRWETDEGVQSFCADIQITGGEAIECYGGCQNGGICSNGHCSCTQQWTGSNCQFRTEVVAQKEGISRTPPPLFYTESGSFELTTQ